MPLTFICKSSSRLGAVPISQPLSTRSLLPSSVPYVQHKHLQSNHVASITAWMPRLRDYIAYSRQTAQLISRTHTIEKLA